MLAKRRCANGDNATLSEFEEVLKAMNMSSLVPLAPRIFDLFDNNRDGTVDMREILCGFSSLRKSQGDDALRLCFQVQSFSILYSCQILHNMYWEATVEAFNYCSNKPSINNLEEKYPCSEPILHSFLFCLTTDVWHRSIWMHHKGRSSIHA